MMVENGYFVNYASFSRIETAHESKQQNVVHPGKLLR
jgi:hypothetical protein